MGRDGGAGAEEFDQFMEVRRHVRRMQAGTPMRLRVLGGVSSGGSGEMQSCTFWITQDLQTLKWREHEGKGSMHELSLNAVADVVEDNTTAITETDEDSCCLTIVLQSSKGTDKKLPSVMSLICESREDLTAWRDGLQLLAGGASFSVAAAGHSSATTVPDASACGGQSAKRSVGKDETQGSTASLRRQLQNHEEMNEKLQKENELLKELVKRKDASIAALLSELKSRSNDATMERCTKTGASSRESDEHLRYREVAILRLQKGKLQKKVRGQKQTIEQLLQVIGNLTQQQGAESSAVEEFYDDDDEHGSEPTAEEEKEKEEREEKEEKEEDYGAQERVATTGRVARFHARESPGPALRGCGGPRAAGEASAAAAAAAAPAAVARDRPSGTAAAYAETVDDALSTEDEEISEEVAALAGQLERLERDMDMEEMQFAPPPRGPSVAASVPATAMTHPAACNFTATEQTSQARPGTLAGQHVQRASGAGLPSGLQGSTAALQALAREMELLEEKKRIVEQLARNLEPPSDGEEDDGFPLR
mmetsp:Transcript_35794/g.70967  ORF Transcript_35794/g.70967 Transcript_35794/m.70967 type:complete len:538 (+) Transcript_35794:86-1699(+)